MQHPTPTDSLRDKVVKIIGEEESSFQENVDGVMALIEDLKTSIIEQLEHEKMKCPCGKYCVQDARNDTLKDAQSIVRTAGGVEEHG